MITLYSLTFRKKRKLEVYGMTSWNVNIPHLSYPEESCKVNGLPAQYGSDEFSFFNFSTTTRHVQKVLLSAAVPIS